MLASTPSGLTLQSSTLTFQLTSPRAIFNLDVACQRRDLLVKRCNSESILEKVRNQFSQFHFVYYPKWIVEIENLLAQTEFLLICGQLTTVRVEPCTDRSINNHKISVQVHTFFAYKQTFIQTLTSINNNKCPSETTCINKYMPIRKLFFINNQHVYYHIIITYQQKSTHYLSHILQSDWLPYSLSVG